MYLTALEVTKSTTHKLGESLGMSEPTLAGFSNFLGGACASAATQSIILPVDVVSQRLMVQGMAGQAAAGVAAAAGAQAGAAAGAAAATSARAASHAAASTSAAGVAAGAAQAGAAGTAEAARMNGLSMAQLILRQEGVRGLYRGYWVSLAFFVPNSALWWGAYGMYQKLLWSVLPASHLAPSSIPSGSSSSSGGGAGAGAGLQGPLAASPSDPPPLHTTGEVVAVQVASSLLAGCSTAVLTNPLDVVKTRLQVST